MFKLPIFRRQNDRPTTRRPQLCRRPLVEDLEGRQLQSGLALIQGAHIGSAVSEIKGYHLGSNVALPGGGGVGQHIGSAMALPGGVGQHIG
jgi:hypothetical protein